MPRQWWGIGIPVLTALITFVVVEWAAFSSTLTRGIQAGMMLALLVSFVSTALLKIFWRKSFIYWVWGGGVLFRLLVFATTAWIVYRHTNFHFVATLVTFVLAMTFFLVVETVTFF